MADLKISALPAATTPVGGTEVLPIVQSSTTKKVSIDNLTKGRVVNALTFDTDVAAAGVTLTGTTLAADGTDANININLTPKGTGTVSTSGYGVSIPGTNTAAVLSNDANGLVITQYATEKVKVRGIGGVGEGTSVQLGEGASSSNPNLSFINDPDTGIYNNSVFEPNQLSLVAGGTQYLHVKTASTVVNETGADHDFRVEGDSDANLLFVDASTDRVGVGTSTPATKFAVSGNTTVTGDSSLDGAVVINEAGADKDTRIEGDGDANLLFADASTDRVGFGTNAPGSKVDVRGVITGGDGTIKTVVSYTATDGVIGTTSNHTLAFYANNATRARLLAGGAFLINTATDNGFLCTSQNGAATGTAFAMHNDSDARQIYCLPNGYYGYQWAHKIYADGGKAFLFANAAGTEAGNIVVNNASVAFNTTSDYRLKDNQKPLTNSGAFIDAIKPKEWVWKSNGERGVGFIAHEFAEVSPSSVSGEKDAVKIDRVLDESGEYVEKQVPAYQSVSYSSSELIANLVAEVQALRKRVAELEAK